MGDVNEFHLVIEFCTVTRADENEAIRFLALANNDLDNAICAFFDEKQKTSKQQISRNQTDPDELLKYWRSEERWQAENALLSEYSKAMNSVVVKPEFMRDSTMRRVLHGLKKVFVAENPQRNWPPRDIEKLFKDSLQNIFDKAWPKLAHRLNRKNVSFHGIASGRNFCSAFQDCERMFSALGWERPYLLQALKILVKEEDETGLHVIVGLMVRGADECNARKRASFYDIVNRVQLNADSAESGDCRNTPPGDTISSCLQKNDVSCAYLRKTLSAYIDLIKDKAYTSTFIEPTKMYFRKVGDSVMEGGVEVHGSNVYLALLASTLGISPNRDPFMREEEVLGVAQFADIECDEGFARGCWSHDNMGKSWESISHPPNTRQTTRL